MTSRVSIAGTGFVGLVTAACFASRKIPTIATNFIDKSIEQSIRNGVPHFFEKDLNTLLEKSIESGYLTFCSTVDEAIPNSDITFIIEGTPMRQDRSIDLQYIEKAAKQIGEGLNNKTSPHLVVVKSTVVPRTTRTVVGKMVSKTSGKEIGKDFGLCMNPEFLREGVAVYDTFNPDRIIIGERLPADGAILEELYINFCQGAPPPILHMSLESAEMVKYTANTFLATKISFANEIATISEQIPGVDVKQVMQGIADDFRINPKFLNAGVGWGGSCFPKDLNAIVAFAKSKQVNPVLLDSVVTRNDLQAKVAVQLANEMVQNLKGKRVAILGLAFKPGTDDMREASSVRIIKYLQEQGVTEIIGYDPHANQAAQQLLGDTIEYAKSISQTSPSEPVNLKRVFSTRAE